ncbi:MAG TPA: hypothetical protein VFE15_03800 [Marmoricola sp.]|jgi:hypothetical protein|nr:hypothetical protein [Marmoricola sp.]
MTASISARIRKASESAGGLAEVTVQTKADTFVYKIRCCECVVRAEGRVHWSSYRKGEDNSFIAAIDRWVLHLAAKHPDEQAPCLEFAEEATRRAVERREQRTSLQQ